LILISLTLSPGGPSLEGILLANMLFNKNYRNKGFNSSSLFSILLEGRMLTNSQPSLRYFSSSSSLTIFWGSLLPSLVFLISFCRSWTSSSKLNSLPSSFSLSIFILSGSIPNTSANPLLYGRAHYSDVPHRLQVLFSKLLHCETPVSLVEVLLMPHQRLRDVSRANKVLVFYSF